MAHKAHAAESEPRPPEHNHEGYGSGYGSAEQPVLVFDLHGTLTPSRGFPLKYAPFDGVREFLDRMAGRGCCLHISTASIRHGDEQVAAARKTMINAYCAEHSLPIHFVGPNVEADARLDDRMVAIPPRPDWYQIASHAEARLLENFNLVGGTYQRRTDLEPEGEEIEFPDPDSVDGDHPRGYTTPTIDIDIHRTLNPAWGSSREAPADPRGVEVVNAFYDEGFQVQLSCPGWNPATRPESSAARLAGMQRYADEYGIHYDRFVTKDDCDLHFDDKGVCYTGDWDMAAALIRARLTSQGLGQPVPKAFTGISPDAVKVTVSTPKLRLKSGAIRQFAYAHPAQTQEVQIEYTADGKPLRITHA